jgi:PAS domain S-box-containing protein
MEKSPVTGTSASGTTSLLQGTGEMADRIRRYPWETTSLGPIASWSETLIATVNLMLLSPFSFAIFWGPEHILLYNEVYRPFLADKHPWALGAQGAVVWQEAWGILGVPIRAAYDSGKSTSEHAALIPILVDGLLEDRWWTYGFYPIFEQDRIIGVVNPGSEDTATVLAERTLRTREEEFDLAMESAGLGMWHYNPKSQLVVADQRMHRIFGSPATDAPLAYWLLLLHPEDREMVEKHFEGALQGAHLYDLEYRILRNGETRWVRSKGKVVGPNGKPERMFAIIEDVTERKLAESALQQNDKLAIVGRLAASIAHEINNPLESVTNLLYLIRKSQDLDEIHEYSEIAERELRRVALITNQTLRFHRQSTSSEPAFCFDLIADSLSIFQARLVNNSIKVEKRKRAQHPVDCLGGEVRQVLSNLIGNAIDAMPSGGRLLLRSREATDPRTAKRSLVITVADTGTGMNPETQRRLFEAFYTTKGMGGTGLGLWISKDIVARHHGRIRFRSRTAPGKSGTVFCLSLPFAQ